ncbi:MAG: HAD hydrolase-like protein [Clostridia bacterium]|nr:HAD hydrolase-like protein [Clostridia bacterium]
MRPALVLFDFDGTVIDNSEGIGNCIQYALDKMGLPAADDETLRSFIGPPLAWSFQRHFVDDADTAAEFVRLYRERFAPVGITEVRLYPGIRELLETQIAHGRKTAVCSSKPMEFVTAISELLSVNDLFSGFFCPDAASADAANAVGKADLILQALKRFRTSPADAVMVGDTRFDVAAAKQAGVVGIGVRYGFSAPGELEAAGADHIVGDVESLGSLLDDLFC